MVKCLVCGKNVDAKKAIFKKGKFFCSSKCEKKASTMKGSKKNVCEFC